MFLPFSLPKTQLPAAGNSDGDLWALRGARRAAHGGDRRQGAHPARPRTCGRQGRLSPPPPPLPGVGPAGLARAAARGRAPGPRRLPERCPLAGPRRRRTARRLRPRPWPRGAGPPGRLGGAAAAGGASPVSEGTGSDAAAAGCGTARLPPGPPAGEARRPAAATPPRPTPPDPTWYSSSSEASLRMGW